jgi:DNA-binding NarL/FixJ family response regulator
VYSREIDMNNPIRTFILDDDDWFCQTVLTFLENSDDVTVVGTATNNEEALARIGKLQPDIILLSVNTFSMNDSHIVIRIRELSPASKLIILSLHNQEHLVLEGFRQGALGHLVKWQSQPLEILSALRAVNRGEAVLSPRMAGRILDEMARQKQSQLRR